MSLKQLSSIRLVRSIVLIMAFVLRLKKIHGCDIMEKLREIIYEIDMKIYELKQDKNTPEIIIKEFFLARKHLGEAYNILNEGGDY